MSMIGHNRGPTMEKGHSWRRYAWGKSRRDLLPHMPLNIVSAAINPNPAGDFVEGIAYSKAADGITSQIQVNMVDNVGGDVAAGADTFVIDGVGTTAGVNWTCAPVMRRGFRPTGEASARRSAK